MKKLFPAILVMICMMNVYHAQSHRFIYDYRYVTDSLRKDSLSTELMQLDIFKDHSEFVSHARAKRDSILFYAPKQQSNVITVEQPQGKVNTRIYRGKEKYSIEPIGMVLYKIPVSQPDWKLQDERKTVNGYSCQKAIAKVNGRFWTAWFTTEIPLQEGPYVFYGLPGLVVSASDDEHFFSYDLVANYKVEKSRTNGSFGSIINKVSVKREKFNDKWKEFRNNPMGMREHYVRTNPNIISSTYTDANGKTLDPNVLYREDRELMKKKLKKENVYLDKNLYRLN